MEKLREETQYVNLIGIPSPRKIQMPLQYVYIKLRAIEKKKAEAHREKEEKKFKQEAHEYVTYRKKLFSIVHELGEYLYRQVEVYHPSQSLDALDPEVVLKENDRIVLLGAPGSGKTTLLRYLAQKATNESESYIPILISLREYASKIDSSPDTTLQNFALEKECGDDDKLRSSLKDAINSGRVLWLVDALDEAQRYDELACRQANRLKGKLILTSRPVGYRGIGLENLPHFEMMPLFLEDTDQFINNWFDQLAKQWGKKPDWVQNCVDSIKSQLEESPQIQSLTRNPLLLTFLVILSSDPNQRKLPDRRFEVYKRYTEELIHSWEKEKYRALDATGRHVFALGTIIGEPAEELALRSLIYIGWYLHLTYYDAYKYKAPSEEEVIESLTEYMTSIGKCETEEGEKGKKLAQSFQQVGARTIIEFWQYAGILDSWSLEDKRYLAFRHLTFQEYAAAWGITEALKKNHDRAWKFLRLRLHHPKWREPILLAAAMMNEPDHLRELVKKLVDGVSKNERALRRDLRLAAMIIGEGVDLDDRLKNKIITKLRPQFRKIGQAFKYQLMLFIQVLLIASFIWLRPAGWIFAVLTICMWTFLSQTTFFPKIHGLLWLPTRLFSYKSTQVALIEALGHTGDKNAVPFLIGVLKEEDHLHEGIHLAAVEALGKIHPTEEYFNDVLFAGLSGSFRTKIPSQRSYAGAVALGKINSPEAVSRLIKLLKGNLQERFMATHALCHNITPEAEPHLIGLLKDEKSALVRGCAVEALGRIGSQKTIPYLVKALKEDSESESFMDLHHERVREKAVWALNRTDSPEIKPYLIEALNDRDISVRVAAAEVLIRIGSQELFPKIIEAIKGSNLSHYRENVVSALVNVQSPAMTSYLFEALENPDGEVRQVAVEFLGILCSPETIPKLTKMLSDDDQYIRAEACNALGNIGSEDSIPHIVQALGDSYFIVVACAAKALSLIGSPQAISPLIDRLKRANFVRGVKLAIIRALGLIGSPQAIPALIDELRRPYVEMKGTTEEKLWAGLRSEAATALGEIGSPEAIPALIEALKDINGRVRFAAAEVLVRMGSPKAALPKFIAPRDPEIRELSVESMGELSYDIEDLTILFKFKRALWWSLTDFSKWVAKEATHALEQVENRISILEVANKPFENILISSYSKPTHWPNILLWISGVLAAIFVGVITSIVNDFIKGEQEWTTRNLIIMGVLLLGIAILGLVGYFLKKKEKSRSESYSDTG